MPAWDNRIVGFDLEYPLDQLKPNPKNARLHPKRQRDTFTEAAEQVGVIAPFLNNKRTGFLVDGHMRLEEMQAHGLLTGPTVHIDCSEKDEAFVLASLDTIGALATFNLEKLAALCEEANPQGEAILSLLAELSGDVSGIDFPEYDESITDTVEYHECPECKYKWPK